VFFCCCFVLLCFSENLEKKDKSSRVWSVLITPKTQSTWVHPYKGIFPPIFQIRISPVPFRDVSKSKKITGSPNKDWWYHRISMTFSNGMPKMWVIPDIILTYLVMSYSPRSMMSHTLIEELSNFIFLRVLKHDLFDRSGVIYDQSTSTCPIRVWLIIDRGLYDMTKYVNIISGITHIFGIQLGCTFDLRELRHRLVNVRFDPRSFSGLIWQHCKIGGNCLLFSSPLLNNVIKTAVPEMDGRPVAKCDQKLLQIR
jgi:hypothetical protein